MADTETIARRKAIRQVLRTSRVGTQEELRAELVGRGYEVTQATLSRDLSQLRARRVTLPDVGSVYEIDDLKAENGTDDLGTVRDLVTGVEESIALVVVMTAPGTASAVALAIDRARAADVLGTIAGDDTIFVAPSRTSTVAAVAKRLRKTWKKTNGKP